MGGDNFIWKLLLRERIGFGRNTLTDLLVVESGRGPHTSHTANAPASVQLSVDHGWPVRGGDVLAVPHALRPDTPMAPADDHSESPMCQALWREGPLGALALAPSLTLSSTCIVLSPTLAPGLASAQSVSVLWSLGRKPLKFRFMSGQLSVLCASLVPASFQTLCVFVECN